MFASTSWSTGSTATTRVRAWLLCDDHPADKVAFTVLESDLTARDLTYGELGERSARLAAALAELGVGAGDAVATLTGKSAELVVSVLAIWRRGAVHVPLFTAFAPAVIAMAWTAACRSMSHPTNSPRSCSST